MQNEKLEALHKQRQLESQIQFQDRYNEQIQQLNNTQSEISKIQEQIELSQSQLNQSKQAAEQLVSPSCQRAQSRQ